MSESSCCLSDNNQADVIVINSISRHLDNLLNIDNPYSEQMVYQIYSFLSVGLSSGCYLSTLKDCP